LSLRCLCLCFGILIGIGIGIEFDPRLIALDKD